MLEKIINNIILIDRKDNVVIAVNLLKRGDLLSIKGKCFKVKENIEFGHKVAISDIEKGNKIIKYEEIIGIAKRKIKKGEHVHIRNVKNQIKKGGFYR